MCDWDIINKISMFCSILSIPLSCYIYKKTESIDDKLNAIDHIDLIKFAYRKKDIILWCKRYSSLLTGDDIEFDDQNIYASIESSYFRDLISSIETLKIYKRFLDDETIKLIKEITTDIENEKYSKHCLEKIGRNLEKLIAHLDDDIEIKHIVNK